MNEKNEIKHPLERYKLIADPTIRQQAIDNFNEEYYNDDKHLDYGSVEDAIFLMCLWGDTEQGLDYWGEIYKKIKRGILPLLPEPIEDKESNQENTNHTPYILESEHERIVSKLEAEVKRLNDKIGNQFDLLVKKQDEIIELLTPKVTITEDPLITCISCNGTGQYREEHGIIVSIEACSICRGSGFMRKSQLQIT